jgi:Flp pilus assembly protein CpaB
MANSSRSRNLGLAAGLALLAAILTMLYVSHGQGGEKANAAVALAPVLVATRDLQIGTSIEDALAQGAIAVRRLPAESIAPNAVTNARTLRRSVVIQPIFEGEQITALRFGPSGVQGLRANLHGPLRAIAITGDPTQLLASALKAGDHVDVVANVRQGDAPVTRIVLRNLLVLVPAAVASTGGPTGTAPAAPTVTLQLTDKQVQSLFWTLKNADWSLALRPPSKATTTANAITTGGDVLAAR